MGYPEAVKNIASEWLLQLTGMSYDELIDRLFQEVFVPSVKMDENRCVDVYCMRERMGWRRDCSGPSRLLEIMVSMADRCESTLTGEVGEFEPGKWLYAMLESMGLSSMCDELYDEDYVEYVLYIFKNREYAQDGKGGLFYVPGIDKDMRKAELWYQLNWFINWREDNV